MRNRRYGRRAVITLTGFAGVAAPLLFASPAGAALIADGRTVELTFVTVEGDTVTCELEGWTEQDTSSSGYVYSYSYSKSANGGFVDECRGSHSLTVTYRDGNEIESFRTFANGTAVAALELSEGDVTNVTVEHEVNFDECDFFANETCTLTTTTAPK